MTAFEERNANDLEVVSTDTTVTSRVTLSAEIAERLLGLLSTDDAYRARFESNPRAALLELGHQTPQAHLGVFGLDPVVNFYHLEGGLASKAVLAAARGRLLPIEARRSFMPFAVCAN